MLKVRGLDAIDGTPVLDIKPVMKGFLPRGEIRTRLGGRTDEGLLVMKIGFIGLGRMGHGVAENLMKAGHKVTVWNRIQAPVQALVAKGATAAQSRKTRCRAMRCSPCWPTTQVMKDVGLAGPLLDKAAKGLVHVNMATISAAFAQELQAAHSKAGLDYISAPVFGRPDMAASARW